MGSTKEPIVDFIPEDKISIDVASTLDQLTAKFKTVVDGLPELIKNSKDHYARIEVMEKSTRQIIVLVSKDKNRLGVLDFGGAEPGDFEGWKTWSSRTAGKKEKSFDIEAGYGNGGKAFMVRGCSNEATMCGYANKKINKWGFKNNDPYLKYKAGIFTDEKGKELKKYNAPSAVGVINKELAPFGLKIGDLPVSAQKVFNTRQRFTFVQLSGILDWKGTFGSRNRAIHNIGTNLVSHSQAALTIESSTVWVQQGDHLLETKPLQVPELEPIPGLENVPPITIPPVIEDPETKEKVKINAGKLVLKTSNKHLRTFGHYIARNVIRVKNSRNIVSNWSLPDLVAMPASGFIYGYLECQDITEDYLTGPDRASLVDRPLIRALKHWTAKELEKMALEIQKIKSKASFGEDSSTANKTLDELRELMKKYLENLKTESNGATGTSGDEGDKEPTGPLRWGKKVTEIVLEPTNQFIKMATGTTIPLVVKCYEIENEKRLPVKGVPLVLCADKIGIVQHESESSIKGISEGKTEICFETEDGDIQSNSISVEIVDLSKLDIAQLNRLLKQGEKTKLLINPIDKENNKAEDLFYEAYVDEVNLAKITRSATLTAGGNAGKITVRIKYGKNDDQVSVCNLEIGEEVVEPPSGSNKAGIPYILLCGTDAPNAEELPEGARTHQGGSDYPTIIDFEPIWENIVWINPESYESQKVRSGRGSGVTGGSLPISSQTFKEFLALKCFEILKRLRVKIVMGENQANTQKFFQELATAEMDTAGFLDAAYKIVSGLTEEKKGTR